MPKTTVATARRFPALPLLGAATFKEYAVPHYEIIADGWEYMPGTSDAYQAWLEVRKDGSAWDAVPARISGIEVLRARRDDEAQLDGEFWSALLGIAAAEVRDRVRQGQKPSESTHAVYPAASQATERVQAGHARSTGPLISGFDAEDLKR